eukprot:snap_masked-scaffold_7-processed-gene-8.29-mRNA-1 protein AED:1.00 eAED:1.00 QI:0/-1/0/0/-1/1/1/0/339
MYFHNSQGKNKLIDVDLTKFFEKLYLADHTEHCKHRLLVKMSNLVADLLRDRVQVSQPRETLSSKVMTRVIVYLTRSEVESILWPFISRSENILGKRKELILSLKSSLPPTLSEELDRLETKKLYKAKRKNVFLGNEDYKIFKKSFDNFADVGFYSVETPVGFGVGDSSLKFPEERYWDTEGKTMEEETKLEEKESFGVKKRRVVSLGRNVSLGKTSVAPLKAVNLPKNEPQENVEVNEVKKASNVLLEMKNKKSGNLKKKSSSESKKSKLKPLDKEKEELELLKLSVSAIEEKLRILQNQLRNVKHRHRKGTACPRCILEQKEKILKKAKEKALVEGR